MTAIDLCWNFRWSIDWMKCKSSPTISFAEIQGNCMQKKPRKRSSVVGQPPHPCVRTYVALSEIAFTMNNCRAHRWIHLCQKPLEHFIGSRRMWYVTCHSASVPTSHTPVAHRYTYVMYVFDYTMNAHLRMNGSFPYWRWNDAHAQHSKPSNCIVALESKHPEQKMCVCGRLPRAENEMDTQPKIPATLMMMFWMLCTQHYQRMYPADPQSNAWICMACNHGNGEWQRCAIPYFFFALYPIDWLIPKTSGW